jgi:hypothetical protein
LNGREGASVPIPTAARLRHAMMAQYLEIKAAHADYLCSTAWAISTSCSSTMQ